MNKESPNDATLMAYNHDIEGYISHTPTHFGAEHKALLFWLDRALSSLPSKDSPILEIGSGTGRDARYIEEKGFKVMRSDGSHSFVELLRQKDKDALELNILYDELPPGYTMIYANAVFPHFTARECEHLFKKIYNYLPNHGLFVFNSKQGEGHIWTTEKLKEKRYIHYWDPAVLVDLLIEIGYKVEYFNQNTPGDLSSHTWTHLILRKIA